jgi:PAS domain S-box-containing protein
MGNKSHLPMLPTTIIILIVVATDRDIYIQHLQSNLDQNYRFIEAETIAVGLELWRSQSPDLVILDLHLPDGDGLDFLTAIANAETAKAPVIVLTEQSREGIAARAMKLGAVDYLIKEEITATALSVCVRQVCDRLVQTRQLREAIHQLQAEQQRASILLSESEQRYNALAEISLKQSEAHQRALISAIPDLIMRINRAGIYLEFVVSPNFHVVGDIEEMVGSHVFESLPINEAQKRLDFIQLALQTNTIQTYEQDLSIEGKIQIEEVRVVPYNEDEVLLLVRDISDRKQAEVALKQSEAQSRAILATIPDLMFRVGADGIYRGFITENRDFGILPHDSNPTGQSMADLMSEEIANQQFYYMQQALLTGELQVYEQQIQIGDRLQDEEVRVIKTGDDEVLFMIRNISDRKQAEAALKQSEFQSRAILAAIPDLMFRMGSDGIYRKFVKEHRDFDILPQTADPTGHAMTDLLSAEIAERHFYYMQQALQTGDLQIYEQQIQVGDHLQDEEVRVIKIGDDEVLFMIRNISDRKQAEAALKQSEMTNRTIIETLPDLLIQMDVEGRYLSMFAGSGVRVICPPASPNPPEIYNVLPADLAEQRLRYTRQAIATGSLQIYEQIVVFENEQRYEEVRIARLNDREVLIIIRDITDAKQVEFERSQNEELIRATRLKDEFLANMSHELRTPLNAILGMTEALLEQIFGDINERQIKALQTIESSGSHLLELINDILDVAKIESGQMELDCHPTAVVPLCQSSLTFIRQQAIAKHIQIKTQLPPNLPDVLVDERRMRQVLINLLNNAVKFTADGGQITLEVTLISQEDALLGMRNNLQIAIADTGIGISPENIHKLFQPFIQIDSALNRKYEGTGLGLALVKRIVELHGGTVGLTSEVGVGSCFTIVIPCADVVPTLPELETQIDLRHEPSPANHGHHSSILLAEDNEANIAMLSTYLENYGYSLLFAKNGLEAIAIAQQEQPDLILMDIQMPRMDGLEAIQKIRQIPSLVNVPIIALTALAMTGDRDRCLAAGATEYLPKPVKLRVLAQMIQNLLNS